MRILLVLTHTSTSTTMDPIPRALTTLWSSELTFEWSNYPVCVKFHLIGTHMLCCSWMHDPWSTYMNTFNVALQMRCHHLHWCFACNIFSPCFYFVAKRCNVARLATMVARLDIFTPRWISPFALKYLLPLSFFSFLFDISCIKSAVMYSIVNSFVDIVFKGNLKCLYEDGKFSSEVMTTCLFFTGISK